MQAFTKLKRLSSALRRRIPSTINPETLIQPKSGQFSGNLLHSRHYKNPSFHTSNIWMSGQRRFYYVDRYGVRHFKAPWYMNWFQNCRNTLIYVAIGTVGSGAYIYWNRETVPYSNRKHFVLLSTGFERWIGEQVFRYEKKKVRKKILQAEHPTSVRVKSIADNILNVLYRDLGVPRGVNVNVDVEIDDKWISRTGDEKGLKLGRKHLEGMKWEVIVVDKPIENAFCLPGGKIVLYTGLLKHFTKDEEIATILGHEIAHAVARHSAEDITKLLGFTFVSIMLKDSTVTDRLYEYFLQLPNSRREELEADYIGLILMASAGYDPRVAIKVNGKLGNDFGLDYISTHPSGKKRCESLAQEKVMEEAMAIYHQRVEKKPCYTSKYKNTYASWWF